jgi:hypothetical protein
MFLVFLRSVNLATFVAKLDPLAHCTFGFMSMKFQMIIEAFRRVEHQIAVLTTHFFFLFTCRLSMTSSTCVDTSVKSKVFFYLP